MKTLRGNRMLVFAVFLMVFFNAITCYELHTLHKELKNTEEGEKPVEFITEPGVPVIEEPEIVEICEQFKSWMDYRAITCKTSRQWVIQELATTDGNGFRRVKNFYICAMGTQYGEVGDCFCINLDSGVTIHVIKGDEKQDIHTLNGEGYQGLDGSVLEFIVDSTVLPNEVRTSGDCSVLGLNGTVVKVSRINSIIQWE